MCKSDNNIADGAGVDPDKQQLLRQLKAGESVLTRVRQEKNKLQDANTQLGEELKDIRAQLSDSMKENRRLRRGIFSKCLNESSKKEFGEEVDSQSYVCRSVDRSSCGGNARFNGGPSSRAVATARTSSAGDARRRPGYVAIPLHARRPWRACREAEGSAAALPVMEDIGLPSRCQGGLGHGEDSVHEG